MSAVKMFLSNLAGHSKLYLIANVAETNNISLGNALTQRQKGITAIAVNRSMRKELS